MFDIPDGDDIHNLELPSEREAPVKPSEEQLKEHANNVQLFNTAQAAVQGAPSDHWLHCFDDNLHKEKHAELKAPTGVPLIVRVFAKCPTCKKEFTLKNIHSKKGHFITKDGPSKCFTGFTKRKRGEEGGSSVKRGRHDEGSSDFQQQLTNSSLPDGQSRMTNFFLPPSISEQFRDVFARLVFENCGSLPLGIVDLPRTKELFKLVGVTPLDRKYLSNQKLDSCYEEAKQEIVGLLEADDGCFALGVDGWRSQYVDNSQKMLNFLALLPHGGAAFLGVERTEGATVDTDALAGFLLNGALKAVKAKDRDEQLAELRARLLGIVMDGEAVNHSALRKLRLDIDHPALMAVICVAHALALLVKDIVDQVPVIKGVVDNAKAVVLFSTTSRLQRES